MDTNDIVKLLNDATKLDKEAITKLVEKRVPCNQALADHETIVVSEETFDGTPIYVGMLGILNGIAVLEGKVIVAKSDEETGKIIEFFSMDKKEYNRHT